MTVVTDSLVEAHQRIALLEALANHLRYCKVCAENDVENCELGKKLWCSSGHALIENPRK
jgi:predicted molibdopterin-dependent oxidoreductase YjgC